MGENTLQALYSEIGASQHFLDLYGAGFPRQWELEEYLLYHPVATASDGAIQQFHAGIEFQFIENMYLFNDFEFSHV